MRKYVQVKSDELAANKKGLRIRIQSVELDENNNLKALHIEYSGLHERGGGIIEVSEKNRFSLPEM